MLLYYIESSETESTIVANRVLFEVPGSVAVDRTRYVRWSSVPFQFLQVSALSARHKQVEVQERLQHEYFEGFS